jgi:hypothetical protein
MLDATAVRHVGPLLNNDSGVHMNILDRCRNRDRVLAVVAAGATLVISRSALAAGDAPPAAAAAAGPTIAIEPLTKYVLPDQTASVMLPDGWHVTQTGVAFIRAEGPHGEIAMFGVTVPAHNGPAGSVLPPQPLSQPYAADPADKLNASIQWVRTANHQSAVQVQKVFTNDAFTAPEEFGKCNKLTVTLGVQGATLAAETDFCSLPMDAGGNYRNFLKIVAISPALVQAERGTVEAMLASYVLNMKAVQQRMAQTGSAPARSAPSAAPGAGQPQSLQQEINAEIAAGGFSPQMVAAMRAQATAQANANMAPMMRELAAADSSENYFDRTVLRGQIPVSVTNQGTFWVDTD